MNTIKIYTTYSTTVYSSVSDNTVDLIFHPSQTPSPEEEVKIYYLFTDFNIFTVLSSYQIRETRDQSI